jgi:Tol biopolymer transport system component
VAFVGDRFTQVDLIKQVRDGVGKTWVSFITINDAKPTGTPGTPTGQGDTESVYIVSPDAITRLKVIDLPASTDTRVYWSPNGAYMAYLILEGDARGLYVLDIVNATTTRLFAIRDFTPRSFPIQPNWAPDSSKIVLMLPSPYDMDIYSIGPDGSNFTHLAPSGGYELWPTWSPDGAYLAFVSDRTQCPSWAPNEPGSCATADGKVPDGGNLFVMDAVSKEVRMLSNQWVGAPPHWVGSTRLAFIQTRPDDPTAGSSLWYVDLRGGSAKQVTGGTDTASPRFATGDAWSPDGIKVLVQESDTTTRLVLRNEAGDELARNTDLNFPRYLFAAAWSPNGQRIAIGGRNGQCPFGMIITDAALKVQLNASGGTPGVCDPQWSPDGRYILYVGTTRSTGSNVRDGRADVYTAEQSGYGARVLSSRLSGQIKLLGWVRGNP